jgi:hypothetical protein
MEKPEPTSGQRPPEPPTAASAPHPVVELTFPPQKTTVPTPAPSNTPSPPVRPLSAGLGLAVVLLFCLVGWGSYVAGVSGGRTQRAAVVAASTTVAPLRVPTGARLINSCAIGRGAQYALPQDASRGPIFNVYQSKVIGLEYVISKSELASNQSFLGLPLYNTRYDHLDIGGQANSTGQPLMQYDVDLYTVSRAVEAGITCK